jgi:hypothetical protein
MERAEARDIGDFTLYKPSASDADDDGRTTGQEPELLKPSLWRRIVPDDKPGGKH